MVSPTNPHSNSECVTGDLIIDRIRFRPGTQGEPGEYHVTFHVGKHFCNLVLDPIDLTEFRRFRTAALKYGIVCWCRQVTGSPSATAARDEWDYLVESAAEAAAKDQFDEEQHEASVAMSMESARARLGDNPVAAMRRVKQGAAL